MHLSRRQIILAGLSLLATGCTPTKYAFLPRPGVKWPHLNPPLSSKKLTYNSAKPTTASASRTSTSQSTPSRPIPTRPSSSSYSTGFRPIARSNWTRSAPRKGRVSPMAYVSKITVHHEGSATFWTTDYRATAKHLEEIRQAHINYKKWGDIGYHYIIDRQGRIWEGRSVRYQGAHVRNHNPHNIGVMLLGNFEKQKPTKAQLATLQNTLRSLMRKYKVPLKRVHTHRELMPTKCPGRNLQPLVVRIRKSGALA